MTPGHWQAAPDCGDSGHFAVYSADGREKLALVIVQPVPPGSGSDAAAIRAANDAHAWSNARAIAALPEVLGALRRCIMESDPRADVLRDALAAYAIATGESL